MLCNNPKLDLTKMNAYIKLGEILPMDSQDIERKRNFGIKRTITLVQISKKMMCNNLKLDLVNINAHIKFGENMSSSSYDIEQKLISA